jgi:HTH-type transcriptional regulator / antitoxin HigA
MLASKSARKKIKLAGAFAELVREMPPRAITNDVECADVVERIDRLMAAGKLTAGQSIYMETLIQLVQAYEASHHAVEASRINGLDILKHLMSENEMQGSDLARLLGVHLSMGSKILKGERALTVEHIKKLSSRFRVNPSIFID